MKKQILSLSMIFMATEAFSQGQILELTFTAADSTAYVRLDSIKIMNRTQGGDTVLYWPDTVLSLFYTGIPENSGLSGGFQVLRIYPNPVTDQATLSLYVPEKDNVGLVVSDIPGRVILETERMLEEGLHSFRFTPGIGDLFFFTARWRGYSSSIKILCAACPNAGMASLEYSGSMPTPPQTKTSGAILGFAFSPGDELLYIGYADTLESGMPDSPEQSQTYTFQFGTNIPCPGTPTVEYEGQVYHTIQVFSQCWLKDNLNVGEMIPGTMEQLNNGTIEKYCYENEPDSCTKYGGLYQWDEMMQYTTQPGAQGICPPGWHLPTDEEWKVLEGAADSHYGICDPVWDSTGGRGYDAGHVLRTILGWYNNEGGSDLFGVSLVPGGYRKFDATFHGAFYNGEWWSSTEVPPDIAWRRRLNYGDMKIFRNDNSFKEYGFSLRCLRD